MPILVDVFVGDFGISKLSLEKYNLLLNSHQIFGRSASETDMLDVP